MNNNTTEPNVSFLTTRLIEVTCALREGLLVELNQRIADTDDAWAYTKGCRAAARDAEQMLLEHRSAQMVAQLAVQEADETLRMLNKSP